MRVGYASLAAALAKVCDGPLRLLVVVKSVSTKNWKFLELPLAGKVAKEG
jgi:hypothetical protein